MDRRALGPLTAGWASSLADVDDMVGVCIAGCGCRRKYQGPNQKGLAMARVRERQDRDADCGALADRGHMM
jgi:hypothetical protein